MFAVRTVTYSLAASDLGFNRQAAEGQNQIVGDPVFAASVLTAFQQVAGLLSDLRAP